MGGRSTPLEESGSKGGGGPTAACAACAACDKRSTLTRTTTTGWPVRANRRGCGTMACRKMGRSGNGPGNGLSGKKEVKK